MNAVQRLESIGQRMRKASELVLHLRSELNRLQQENDNLRAELARQRVKPKDRSTIETAGTSIEKNADYKHLQSQLNLYIDELDRCMDWLKKQT